VNIDDKGEPKQDHSLKIIYLMEKNKLILTTMK